MATSKSIKEKLGFVKSMQRLIEALKDIDSAHFQSLFKQKEVKFERFDYFFMEFFKMAAVAGIHKHHPLMKPKTVRIGVIVITSDASFMGKLNSKLCKAAQEEIRDPDDELIVVGKKGLARLKYAEAKIKFFSGIIEKKRYDQAIEIKDYVIKQVLRLKIGKIMLVFPRAISFARQDVEVLELLPALPFVDLGDKPVVEKWQEVCIESDLRDIFTYLTETYITRRICEVYYEAKLAEYAARTLHLESSLDYLSSEAKRLALSLNKARQGEIDAEMRDSFSSLMGSPM